MTTKEDLTPICLLHPGKTGGTYLKSVIRHNRSRWSRPIQLLSHRETITSTLRDFGSDRKLAFTFRDPVARFVSAFQSRRRQGRPTYSRMWSPAEATSFLFFDTANQLAEALDSSNERDKSAAFFAFNAIMHIKTNYSFHFESLKTLANETGNIITCIDTQNLQRDLPFFLTAIGIEEFELPDTDARHANPETTDQLSDRALRNLQSFWAMEFEFYQFFKEMEGRMGVAQPSKPLDEPR
ncbi:MULTISPECIES: sulfotransferase family 2 domain-containing protein [unclassified Roseovarius]|uniref:sulfotransferase family 2 domain-containing protein n=1 Tax=unclassified Roseovarius TaxID=2614913 RepID=UPI00273DE681|nr:MULTISPECIES: sulfotransferase family 2 domain-containing protein [unclassified Roseovarius]